MNLRSMASMFMVSGSRFKSKYSRFRVLIFQVQGSDLPGSGL